MARTQKNMRLDSELVERLSTWAEKHGMTYAAATEYAMKTLLDSDATATGQAGSGASNPANANTSDTTSGAAPADSLASASGETTLALDDVTVSAMGDTLRELMASNVSLTAQLGKAQENTNEANRNLLAATMQIKALPSADEVSAKEQVARSEGEKQGRAEGRAEREDELAKLGVFGYMSWRRGYKSSK